VFASVNYIDQASQTIGGKGLIGGFLVPNVQPVVVTGYIEGVSQDFPFTGVVIVFVRKCGG
jgi:hypothetical protein